MVEPIADCGILLMPPIDFDNRGMKLSFAEHDARLLFHLLYFDDVAVAPWNVNLNGGMITSTELEQTLVQQEQIRVVQLPRFTMNTWVQPSFFAEHWLLAAHRKLASSSNKLWALAPHTALQGALDAQGDEVITLKLLHGLPSPKPGVEPAQIIEFRNTYRSKLKRLHTSFHKSIVAIQSAKDADYAHAVEIREMNEIIDDIEELIAAANMPSARIPFEVSFNLSTLILKPLIIAIAAKNGVDPATAALMGDTISNTIGIAFKRRKQFPNSSVNYPPAYEFVARGFFDHMLTREGQKFEYDIHGTVLERIDVESFYPSPITPPTPSTHGESFHMSVISDRPQRPFQPIATGRYHLGAINLYPKRNQ